METPAWPANTDAAGQACWSSCAGREKDIPAHSLCGSLRAAWGEQQGCKSVMETAWGLGRPAPDRQELNTDAPAGQGLLEAASVSVRNIPAGRHSFLWEREVVFGRWGSSRAACLSWSWRRPGRQERKTDARGAGQA